MKIDKYMLPSNCLAVEGNKAWFVSSGSGFWGLYELNLLTDEVRCFGELPIEYGDVEPYAAIGKIGNLLLIAPRFFLDKAYFLEFDLSNESFQKTYVDIAYMYLEAMNAKAGFSDAIKYKDSIFFLGTANGFIVEYQSLTKQYVCHDIWMACLQDRITRDKMSFQRHGYSLVDNELYLVPVFTNLIIEVNLDELSTNVYVIPYEFSALMIYNTKNGFRVLSYDNLDVVEWYKRQGGFNKTTLDCISLEARPYFYSGFSFDDSEVFLPCCGDKVVVLKKDNVKPLDTHTYFDESENQTWNDRSNVHFYLVQDTGDRLFAYHLWSGFLYEFNRLTKRIIRHEYNISYGLEMLHYMKSCAKRNISCIIYENEDLDIGALISAIRLSEHEAINNSNNVGEMIYKKVLLENSNE